MKYLLLLFIVISIQLKGQTIELAKCINGFHSYGYWLVSDSIIFGREYAEQFKSSFYVEGTWSLSTNQLLWEGIVDKSVGEVELKNYTIDTLKRTVFL